VHSARFAGPDADDAANRARLLHDLAGETNRAARFRTVLVFMEEDNNLSFDGVCEGTIIDEERGAGGFGYDALFVPQGYTRTFAELPAEEKNRISHRGRALQSFVAYLRDRFDAEASS
jgi:XTP/dITP diphosphohydrolase